MNTTYITEFYSEYSTKLVHEVAKRLVKKGCEVNVLTSNYCPGSELKLSDSIDYIDGVGVVRFKSSLISVANKRYICCSAQAMRAHN